MIKQIKNLKGIILAICLLLSFISVAKVKVNIDGTININLGRNRERDRSDNDYWGTNNSIGDITDSQYILKPFLMNGKGYAVIKDSTRFYILQVTFYNGDPNRVKTENIFNANTFSSNCLAIAGDSNYCLTITKSGNPALWDRNRGQLKYVGRWIKNSNYRDYDYYNNSNQPWFEW